MRLFHATSRGNALSIVAIGFNRSDSLESPGANWLASTVQGALATAAAREWLVLVDVPDDVAEEHRYRLEEPDGPPHPTSYRLPWNVVNLYRPFGDRPVTPAEALEWQQR